MKLCIAYSSLTGNTRRLAEGIAAQLSDCQPVVADVRDLLRDGLPDADTYLVGFWADKGAADALASRFLRSLTGVRVGLFGTLGVYPYGPHARKVTENAEALLDASCEHLGSFLCQGKLSESALRRALERSGPATPAVEKRRRLAANHPNQLDMQYAAALFRERL